jgi:iron complex transport system ATP-binding protein
VLGVHEVSFHYGDRRAVGGVSFSVAAGELVAMVGVSGAGKSTLVRLAAGLIAPSTGRITIDGADPLRLPRRALARKVAYLAQDHHLGFPFTVAEVVLMGRYPHRGGFGLEDAADRAAAEDAMRRCAVLELAARRFGSLSGGERRRALLAQAFCQGADLLLLDEPTAALDPAHALAVLEVVVDERRRRQAAALWVTHDLNLAARFADRVLVVDAGQIVAAGPPSEVLAGPAAARAFGVDLFVGRLPSGTPFVVPGDSAGRAP